MILGVLAEHSLPLTMAPVLVDLSQQLAADKPALSQMKLSRTAASYKMVHGLGHTFSERTLANLRRYLFLSTWMRAHVAATKKRLPCLFCYYNEECNNVVVEHLGSLEVFKVSAASLEGAMCHFFEEKDVPWSNLISIMLDSCNVMRGSKSGLETRVREMVSNPA